MAVGKGLRRLVFERDGLVCHWCRVDVVRGYRDPLPPHAATIDHVIPKSEGGPDAIDNLVVCCNACNQRRSRHTASPPITDDELMQLMGWK